MVFFSMGLLIVFAMKTCIENLQEGYLYSVVPKRIGPWNPYFKDLLLIRIKYSSTVQDAGWETLLWS